MNIEKCILNLFIFFIKFYRLTKKDIYFFLNSFGISSPMCKFHPTCSQYSIDAISKYGVLKGCLLSAKRIISCNFLNKKNGFDPVP